MKFVKFTLILGLVFPFLLVRADDASSSNKTKESYSMVMSGADDKDWSIELGAGIFKDIPVSDTRAGIPGYTVVPVDLTASLTVDDVSLDDFCGGIFRGNTEFFFRGFGMAVPQGTESRFIGFNVGPRYNFVQKSWPVVPFLECGVGHAFTDSKGLTTPVGQVGQGQDFLFSFKLGTGIRYDIDESLFLRLGVYYNHFSNAGLSEPERENHGLDLLGPELMVGCRF